MNVRLQHSQFRAGRDLVRLLAAAAMLALTIVVAAGPADATASGWSTSRLVGDFTDDQFDSVADTSGLVHIASVRSGFGAGIWYHRPQADGTYASEKVSTVDADAVAIALDGGGLPVLAHVGSTGLRIARAADGGWRDDPIGGAQTAGYEVDLAIDAQGHRHVAWLGAERRAWYGTDASGRWQSERLQRSAEYSSAIAVAVGADGVVHVALERAWDGKTIVNSGGLGAWAARTLGYSHNTGYASWETTDPSLAVDDTGDVQVVWANNGIGQQTMGLARYHAGSWTAGEIPVTGTADYGALVHEPALTFRAGRPAIAFLYDKYSLAFTELGTDGSWHQQVFDSNAQASEPAIETRIDGTVELLYRQSGPDVSPFGPRTGGIDALFDGVGDWTYRSLVKESVHPGAVMARAPGGTAEVLLQSYDDGLSLFRETGGRWNPQELPSTRQAETFDMAIGPHGEHDVVFSDGFTVMLQADRDGVTTRLRLGKGFAPQVAVDDAGTVHVVFTVFDSDYTRTLHYVRVRESQITTEVVPRSVGAMVYQLAVSPGGNPHVAWDRSASREEDRSVEGLRHASRGADGTWHIQRLTHFYRGDLAGMAVGPDGTTWVLAAFLGADLWEIHGSSPSKVIVPVDYLRAVMGLDGAGHPTIVGSTWEGGITAATRGTRGWTTRQLPGDYHMTPAGVVVDGNRLQVLVRREGSNGWPVPGQGWLVLSGPR